MTGFVSVVGCVRVWSGVRYPLQCTIIYKYHPDIRVIVMAATRRADDVDHGAEMDRYMAAVREVQGDAYTDAKYSAGKYLSSETRDVCDRPLMAGDTFGMYFRLCARPDTAPNAVAADAQRLEAAGWDVACETDDEGRRVIHAFKSTTVTEQ